MYTYVYLCIFVQTCTSTEEQRHTAVTIASHHASNTPGPYAESIVSFLPLSISHKTCANTYETSLNRTENVQNRHDNAPNRNETSPNRSENDLS